jgi:hypothetical protein
MIPRLKVSTPMQCPCTFICCTQPSCPSSSPEPAADHTARKVSRDSRSIHSIRSKAASLAELVASRKSKRIRDGEDERNNCQRVSLTYSTIPLPTLQLTNQRQPNELEPNQRKDGQDNPEHRLRIQSQPKEALVCRILLPALWIRRLKHPAPITRGAINLVPPAQSDQAPSSNVLEVVEVDGEEQDGDDEDEDEVGGEELQAKEVD